MSPPPVSPRALARSQEIARAITENDDTWREFIPYNLVWAGGRLGRVCAQAAFAVRNWQEEIEANLAQRREGLRLTKRAPSPAKAKPDGGGAHPA